MAPGINLRICYVRRMHIFKAGEEMSWDVVSKIFQAIKHSLIVVKNYTDPSRIYFVA